MAIPLSNEIRALLDAPNFDLARDRQRSGRNVLQLRQMMALIEGAQRQQTGIAGDLAPGKIGADGLMTVEGEAQLW